MRNDFDILPCLAIRTCELRREVIAVFEDTFRFFQVGESRPIVSLVNTSKDDMAFRPGTRDDVCRWWRGDFSTTLVEVGVKTFGVHDTSLESWGSHENRLATAWIDFFILYANESLGTEAASVDDERDFADTRKVVSFVEGRKTVAVDGDA